MLKKTIVYTLEVILSNANGLILHSAVCTRTLDNLTKFIVAVTLHREVQPVKVTDNVISINNIETNFFTLLIPVYYK